MSKHIEKIVFGIVSDTHLGSMYDRIDLLEDFYKELKNEKIKVVYHAGDVTDGYKIYRGQEFEMRVWGLESLLDYTIKNYPKYNNITTFFILGNHDTKHFYWKDNIDIGREINVYRKDLIPIYNKGSPSYGRVVLGKNKNIKVDIIHPAGGAFYSKSYGAQKYYREQKRNIPDIAIFGHRHQKMHFDTRGIEIYEAGCFMDADESEYYRRKGLQADLGGWIVVLTLKNGKIKHIEDNFITYN